MKRPHLYIVREATGTSDVYPVIGTLYGYTGQLYVAFDIEAAREYRNYISLYRRNEMIQGAA